MNRLSICAIVKNEAPYLREWVEFHRRVGVEHFQIYENESTDDTKAVLAGLGNDVAVETIRNADCGGWPPQFRAYQRSLDVLCRQSQWVAYIDADEFLHPVADDNVTDVLRDFEGWGGLVVPWRTFGSNGEMKYRDEPVLRRFTRRGVDTPEENSHVKTIYNMRFVTRFKGDVHGCCFTERPVVDEFKRRVRQTEGTSVCPHPVTGARRLLLHHYFCKSREEWEWKRQRGRADIIGAIRDDADFVLGDLNDVEDTRILRFLP